MPNHNNVCRPITLVGNGRSGTSLLMQLFNRHPDIFVVGESANLIHSVWHSLDHSLGSCNLVRGSRNQSNLERIYSETILDFFTKNFYSEETHWFHKPIGTPNIYKLFGDLETYSQWYWHVFKNIFPESKTIAIVRNPLDVLKSSYRHWGWPIEEIAYSMTAVANTLTHGDAELLHVIQFEKLLNDPAKEVEALFSKLDIKVPPSFMETFEAKHAPNNNVKPLERDALNTTRPKTQTSHSNVDLPIINAASQQEFRDSHYLLYEKLNLDTKYLIF